MSNRIDTIRHINLFSSIKFGQTRVDVIGQGAIGGKVGRSLSSLGIENLHIWDYDNVEEHNIANQDFDLAHIGMSKVAAMADVIKRKTGLEVEVHPEKVVDQKLGKVVFLCVDTMASRKEIFENCLKGRLDTKLVIETRMGADVLRIYTFDPNMPNEFRSWEKTLCGDDEAEVSLCGTKVSVGPTAGIVAELAVWQLIKWCRPQDIEGAPQDDDNSINNEVILSLRPEMSIIRKFSTTSS